MFSWTFFATTAGDDSLAAAKSRARIAADASFVVVPGLADANKSSFRSYNFGRRYLRHRWGQLWVEEVSENLGKQDATWERVQALSP